MAAAIASGLRPVRMLSMSARPPDAGPEFARPELLSRRLFIHRSIDWPSATNTSSGGGRRARRTPPPRLSLSGPSETLRCYGVAPACRAAAGRARSAFSTGCGVHGAEQQDAYLSRDVSNTQLRDGPPRSSPNSISRRHARPDFLSLYALQLRAICGTSRSREHASGAASAAPLRRRSFPFRTIAELAIIGRGSRLTRAA